MKFRSTNHNFVHVNFGGSLLIQASIYAVPIGIAVDAGALMLWYARH